MAKKENLSGDELLSKLLEVDLASISLSEKKIVNSDNSFNQNKSDEDSRIDQLNLTIQRPKRRFRSTETILGIISLLIAVTGIILAVTTPEARKILGLDKEIPINSILSRRAEWVVPCARLSSYILINEKFDPNNPDASKTSGIKASNMPIASEIPDFPNLHGGRLDVTVSGLQDETIDIWFSKKVGISVSRINDAPQEVDVVIPVSSGCAGGLDYLFFNPIDLQSSNYTYDVTSTPVEERDFFISRGEHLVLSVPFYCKSPGYYSVNTNLEYEYRGAKARTSIPSSGYFLCPNQYKLWKQDEKSRHFSLVGYYIWDGEEYISSYKTK